MTRVHTVARAGRKERSASVRTNHRKPAFKIVKEVVTQEKKKFRTVASYNAEPPHGYSFIPVGYPDLTELCKRKCQDQNLQFQTVNAKPKNKANLDPDKVSHHIHRVGNHFPTDIVQRSCQQLGYWINPNKPGEYKKYNVGLEDRLARHKHKDEKDRIRSAIQELFPNLPPRDLKEILHHAFRKGSMRVGNADMPLIRRVQLAVSAHARHNYTDYDGLLKKVSWAEARQLAEQPTLNQLKAWRGEDFDNHETEQVLRETIIIDSESDDSSDDDSSDDSDDTPTHYGNRDVSLEIVSHNTYGDDRMADQARTGTTYYDEAYVASSRRQAQHQSLSARNHRGDVPSYQAAPRTCDRLQAVVPAPVAAPYHRQPGGPYTYVEPARPYPRPAPEPAASSGAVAAARYSPSFPYSPNRHERYGASAPATADEHTRPDFPNPAYSNSSKHDAHLYDRVYERRLPSHPNQYDPKFPRLVRQATPDRALPSVENASPYRPEVSVSNTTQSGLRLITDPNGRTVLVNISPKQGSTSDAFYPSFAPAVPNETSKRRAPVQVVEPDAIISNGKRFKSSGRDAYCIPPQSTGMIDLTMDSPPRNGMNHRPPAGRSSGGATYPTDRREPSTGVRYQLVAASNDDLGRSPRAPLWVDGAQDRPEPRYDYGIDPARQGPRPQPAYAPQSRATNGQSAHSFAPTASSREEHSGKHRPVPQPHHPDDSMRSLYDEREPQQQRKAYHKKHHGNRPRYHDHDMSAARQQDQPLDYL